jgi:diguanylate cyclase (GGDEF)-like protein/PAS domain S-box-containing protein
LNHTKRVIPKPLLRRLMLPFTFLIFIFLVSVGYLFYQQHSLYLHDSFDKDFIELDHDMQMLLDEQTSSISLGMKPIINDSKVQHALREKDAAKLLAQWQDIFQTMKTENAITHFYFMDRNRVCLLRVHNPSKKGDVINRFTMLEAEWSKKRSSGIELGPMGTLTLRVVEPVIVDNELIGYVEMGKEIEDVLQQLHFQSDIELAMVIRKKYLERSEWEEGMRLIPREANWDLLRTNVLIYSTYEKVPNALVEVMNQRLFYGNAHNDPDQDVYAQGNTYRMAMMKVKDVSGKEVGDLFVLKNITNENREFFDSVSVWGMIGLAMMGGMIGFFYLLLRRSDDEIAHQQHHLIESQERFEQLAHHSRTIAWEVNSEGIYTYVSDAVYEVLGYTAEEIVGRYIYDFYPIDEREKLKEDIFDVFKRKEPFTNSKHTVLKKDGKVVWLMTNGIPLTAPDGRLIGYRGNDTDITAWQKAEDTIIESRNLLDSIIDTIPIRVFWKSKSLRYLGCNTLFAKDAGLEKPSDLIGKDDFQMGWAAEAEMYRADDRAVMDSGEGKLFFEEEQTTPDGKKIWLSTSKVPLKKRNGEVFGILGIYEDITKQKEMQEDLRRNAERLNEAQHFARMGSWSFDLIDQSLVWSDEVFCIFELDPSVVKASYEALMDRIHPEDRDRVNNAYMSSLSTQQPYEVTHRLVMDDGRIKWVHESGISEFDHQGKPLRSMGTVQDISERKIAEEEIERLAFYDSLTRLPNRTLLIDRLNQARVLSGRSKQFCALLLIDLDHFKVLNDTLGHGIGDILLKQSANRLIESLREGDSVARLGGDEFVILLTSLGSDEQHAAAGCEVIGKKLLSVLNQPYELEGIPYQSTASIGITLFQGDKLSDDELMKQADLAMYKSKDLGRNVLSFFDPEMESSLKERSLLEEEIRRGIDEEQFLLYYQPQVLEDGSVYGAEVLVRWNHPDRGVVSPAEFIPIAEETGLIVPLGQWILKTACYQIREWSMQEGFEELSIAVNVSARQFNQPDFVEQIIDVLKESNANPKRLKLELTESLLVQNIEEVIEKMVRLKDYGVRFSLDDFGTGYSSLSYLKQLPLDQLKIDQSFVRDILNDPNDAIICKSTIALSQSMGLSVIAEGVENKDQMEVLLSLGCRAYQGYYFSRPLALEAFQTHPQVRALKESAKEDES